MAEWMLKDLARENPDPKAVRTLLLAIKDHNEGKIDMEELKIPMIRELVCAYLVEKGYQKERYHYTRLGLPYADFKELHAILMRLDPAQKFHEVEKAIIKDLIQEIIYFQIKREYHGVDKLYNDL